MMLLTIRAHRRTLNGTLVGPKRAAEDWQGEFSGIFLPIRTRSLSGKPKDNTVEIVLGPKSDQDRAVMRLADRNHLLLAFYRGVVPDWRFTRATDKQPIHVSTDWPEYDDNPKIVQIRQQLQAMAQEDKAVRERRWIDPKEIAALTEQDRQFLESVFKQYGWPKISVFDVIPCNNFWILVQHQSPAVQEQMLPSLKNVVDEDEASKTNYAYLFDRVQTDLGKPQHWGTQSKCEYGHAVLYPVDDMPNIDKRRKAIGLGPLDGSLKASDRLCQRVRN
ncbi:MAG: DUF6624 domain-containing protein [Terriglobales bacterium]